MNSRKLFKHFLLFTACICGLLLFSSFNQVFSGEVPVVVYVKPPEGYEAKPIEINQITAGVIFQENSVRKITLNLTGKNFDQNGKVSIGSVQKVLVFIDSEHIQIITEYNEAGIYVIDIVNPDRQKITKTYEYLIPSVTPTITPTITPSIIISPTTTDNNIITPIVTRTNTPTPTTKVQELPQTGNPSETIKEIVEDVVVVLNNPQTQNQIAVVTTTTSILALSGTLDYLKLIIIPFRKKRKYWGVVYEQETSKPVPFTMIELRSTDNKLISTSISDMEGRYGLVANPGEYILQIRHSDYQLNINSPDSDSYKGQKLIITQEKNINFNIVLTNKNNGNISFKYKFRYALNSFLKAFGNFYPYILGAFLFLNIIFFIASLKTAYLYIIFYHIIVVVYYIYFNTHFQKQWGICIDSKTNNGIRNALLKIYNISDSSLLDNKMSDQDGRYQFILPKGKYILYAQATGYTFPSMVKLEHQDGQKRVIVDSAGKLFRYDIPLDPIDLASTNKTEMKFGVL